MICPFLSIGKPAPMECVEEDCEMFVRLPDKELTGCTLYAHTVAMGNLEYTLQTPLEDTVTALEDAVKELHSIAQGTGFIPDICG